MYADDHQSLQAMDNSHVALVSLKLYPDQFESYRCDRSIPLGVNVGFTARHRSRATIGTDLLFSSAPSPRFSSAPRTMML